MQNIRKCCHNYFDKSWKQRKISKNNAYKKLALLLNIEHKDCHFGYFDLETLQKAYAIVEKDNWWA